MIDIPNPVSIQYIMSDKEAPKPVKNPDHLPPLRVRRIHSAPIGPIGAEISNPIINPFNIMFINVSINANNLEKDLDYKFT